MDGPVVVALLLLDHVLLNLLVQLLPLLIQIAMQVVDLLHLQLALTVADRVYRKRSVFNLDGWPLGRLVSDEGAVGLCRRSQAVHVVVCVFVAARLDVFDGSAADEQVVLDELGHLNLVLPDQQVLAVLLVLVFLGRHLLFSLDVLHVYAQADGFGLVHEVL